MHATSNILVLFILNIVIIFNCHYVESSSGCQRCSETGDCAYAFRNQQGKYCGHFTKSYDFLPCCCPAYAECKVSQFDCNCHVNDNNNNNRNSYNQYDSHSSNSYDYDRHSSGSSSVWTLVTFILIVICCVRCCISNNNDNKEDYTLLGHNQTCTPGNPPSWNPEVLTAQAVVVESSPKVSYGTVPQAHQSSGAAQSIGAGVLGAAAGYLFGSAFSGRHGNGGGDGGFDISGDSGFGGGYDISGDSGGGGGFDIAGDS